MPGVRKPFNWIGGQRKCDTSHTRIESVWQNPQAQSMLSEESAHESPTILPFGQDLLPTETLPLDK